MTLLKAGEREVIKLMEMSEEESNIEGPKVLDKIVNGIIDKLACEFCKMISNFESILSGLIWL